MKRVIKKTTKNPEHYMDEVLEEFISEKEARNLSKSTIRCYRQSVNYFIDFTKSEDEEQLNCASVTQRDVFKWMNFLNNEGVKPTSINHYLRDVRTFLYWCMDESRGYIPTPFKVEMVKGQEESIKVFTDEEQKKLIEKPARSALYGEWRTWAIVNWILATGNRSSTVCNIKMCDLNFTKREIILGHTKNKQAQIIPMSSALESVIKEFVRMWRSDASPNDYLFANVGNQQLTTNALRHSFAKYTEERGIERTNIHGLRHTFAREFILNSGNVFMLQQLLGHKTIQMTEKYIRLFQDDYKEHFDNYNPLDQLKKGYSRKQVVKKGGRKK